jgi:hypothetical protein
MERDTWSGPESQSASGRKETPVHWCTLRARTPLRKKKPMTQNTATASL